MRQPPAGTTGTIAALNKQGVAADVVGTGALIHTQQTTANLKFAYDFLPGCKRTYCSGIWNNVQISSPADLFEIDGHRRADIRRRVRLCQQRIYLEPDAYEQCGLAQKRHQRRI